MTLQQTNLPNSSKESQLEHNSRLKSGSARCLLPLDYSTQVGLSTVHFEKAESLYSTWPDPICIVADGPYGLSGFPGDLPTVSELPTWYKPHIEAWARRATPQTTLWFWNSELGWATVHPILDANGWDYRSCHIWDKGLGHVAGNANTRTLRKFPVTTEVCVQYVKRAEFESSDGEPLTMQQWLRYEWKRTGLPLRVANEACGVRNAATRKYLTQDHLWYFPPPKLFTLLSAYANRHGSPTGRPYYSLDGKHPVSEKTWDRMRAKFKCPVGVTNVWSQPHVGGRERVNGERLRMRWKYKSLHGSQKPLNLIALAITATTDVGDVIWEPFGGLCPASVASLTLERRCFSAEIVREFYDAAVKRLLDVSSRP